MEKSYQAAFYQECKTCTSAKFCYARCTPEEVKTEEHKLWRQSSPGDGFKWSDEDDHNNQGE